MSAATPVDPLSAAAGHAELGLPLAGSLPKRVIERLTRFLLEPQRAYNRGVIDAIRILREDDRRLGHQISAHARAVADLPSAVTRLDLELADARTDAALVRAQVLELARAVQRIESRLAELDAAGPDAPPQQAAD